MPVDTFAGAVFGWSYVLAAYTIAGAIVICFIILNHTNPPKSKDPCYKKDLGSRKTVNKIWILVVALLASWTIQGLINLYQHY